VKKYLKRSMVVRLSSAEYRREGGFIDHGQRQNNLTE